MYFLQQWFGLADEALEDTVYDSQAFRSFLGLDLGRESVPDATTLLNVRHLLEEHGLAERIFETVKAAVPRIAVPASGHLGGCSWPVSDRRAGADRRFLATFLASLPKKRSERRLAMITVGAAAPRPAPHRRPH